MKNVPELFGSKAFNEREMKKRLSSQTFNALKRTISQGKLLSSELADEIAEAMKLWAIEKGATHYTHWFQPMTGLPAEKHDSFIDPQSDGSVIMTFKGRELVKGESDASSFPSGGMRDTCEARGYTAWDPTSYAFVIGTTLYIPTCFISFTGAVLDKKTPLLRATAALDRAATRLTNLLGVRCESVQCMVGSEQEYFLIDRKQYNARKDIIYTGRTLFGAAPPKGQELEDNYFGSIRSRVLAFMEDVDEQLWALGVNAKTRHNETAPCQHELAPVYTKVTVAADHNLLMMEVMKRTAERHGLACLLHEKPFRGISGSGKHNNWSIVTDTGKNLLHPGKHPESNVLFLVTIAAVVQAVHTHADLLRLSVASAGNDHRLGASEAPPAILSVYLGDQVKAILDAIEQGRDYINDGPSYAKVGVEAVPEFIKDTSDRNRTSPFAFTGNKFEFRALGAPTNISCPNVMINIAVADAMEKMADQLEAVSGDRTGAAYELIRKTYREHKAAVYNGNNYSEDWINAESVKRGLINLKSTPDALELYTAEKNVRLFEHFGVFTIRECEARKNILLEMYAKILNIEAYTMHKMVAKQFCPACVSFMNTLAESIERKKICGASCEYETAVLKKESALVDRAYLLNNELEELRRRAVPMPIVEKCKYLHDTVMAKMDEVRAVIDALELLTASKFWPLPSYGDMLFTRD